MSSRVLVNVALACALACIACIGCGAAGGAAEGARTARVAPPDADDDVRELVMRELIVSFGAMEWSKAPYEQAERVNVLCIGFGENVDPSDAFMARLADEHRVVKASRCRYDEAGRVVRAEPSGLPAMFLYVEEVHRDGSLAEAKGSYFHDGKGAKEDRFVLQHDGTRWVVRARTTISIS